MKLQITATYDGIDEKEARKVRVTRNGTTDEAMLDPGMNPITVDIDAGDILTVMDAGYVVERPAPVDDGADPA